MTKNLFALLVTLPKIDERIPKYHSLLRSSPRSDPNRPFYLLQFGALRSQRHALSNQKSDLDKAITHLTEAVLLPQTQNIVFVFFHLAALLLLRFILSRQPDDVKSSLKYFHFLRIKFHSLEAFDIPQDNDDLSSLLLEALSVNSLFTPGDMVQDFEEMVALISEVVTADTLTYRQKKAMGIFSEVVVDFNTTLFRREDTQQIANRAIQVLREATVLNPDLHISFALAFCLIARFQKTLVMNDYEEAIAIFDKIVATCTPGNSPTRMQRRAMLGTSALLVSRLDFSARPEYLEYAIHRIRTLISWFPDEHEEDCTNLALLLDVFTQQRSNYFGVAGNSGALPPNHDVKLRPKVSISRQPVPGVNHLEDVVTAIRNGEITDVEVAVERSRKLLSSQKSSDQWLSPELAERFAEILLEAFKRTKRLGYLDEAITAFRDLRKMSVPNVTPYDIGCALLLSLLNRFELSHRRQDLEELMQLLPELVNDGSGEVFDRVVISSFWARLARQNMHSSVSIAYETTMSLLQETLFFCPTLPTQHLHIAEAFKIGGRFSSDYASYQIDYGQVKRAIETLEQGRALLWSEMRDLRASTDELRLANQALADKFTNINQRLKSVAMSVGWRDDGDLGNTTTETETGRRDYSIGHLVLTQKNLLEERNSVISHIQSLPGFEHFLKSPSFDFLKSVASHGPVIIVNQSQFSSHIILLLKNSRPFIISTPSGFHHRANQLENDLLRVRKEKGLDSKDHDRTLASVLSDLYELVGQRVIERLRKFKVPEKSRVWWCPTGAFCSLPFHAMDPIPSGDGKGPYFSDLYIPSYTPSLSALIESRKHGSSSRASDNSKPSILLVAQPDTLPGAFGEIAAIQTTKTLVTPLVSAMATPESVIEGLRDHRFAHFVCHGLLESGKPFDAALELHKDNLTLLAIVRSQLPAAEFAFLSACHTAELTEGSAADEGLHLTAAMQYCGFRSVVGTMWAMADADGADLSKCFYKTIFSNNLKAIQDGVPYHERSARALQIAVRKLRKKRGMTLERWVNFVHYGA